MKNRIAFVCALIAHFNQITFNETVPAYHVQAVKEAQRRVILKRVKRLVS